MPVNPRYDSILGERCYARLEDIPEPVDMVDVFRRTEDVLPIARQRGGHRRQVPVAADRRGQPARPTRWRARPGSIR